MIPVLLAMLGIVLLAALVVVYVAFPHRGIEVPHAAWLGRAISAGIGWVPTLDADHDTDADADADADADRDADRAGRGRRGGGRVGG